LLDSGLGKTIVSKETWYIFLYFLEIRGETPSVPCAWWNPVVSLILHCLQLTLYLFFVAFLAVGEGVKKKI
jgi:hypothetical protein